MTAGSDYRRNTESQVPIVNAEADWANTIAVLGDAGPTHVGAAPSICGVHTCRRGQRPGQPGSGHEAVAGADIFDVHLPAHQKCSAMMARPEFITVDNTVKIAQGVTPRGD